MTSKIIGDLVSETRIPLDQGAGGPDALVVVAFNDAEVGLQMQWDDDGPSVFISAGKARQLAAQLVAAAQASEDGAA